VPSGIHFTAPTYARIAPVTIHDGDVGCVIFPHLRDDELPGREHAADLFVVRAESELPRILVVRPGRPDVRSVVGGGAEDDRALGRRARGGMDAASGAVM
jgi:hypothetical protein